MGQGPFPSLWNGCQLYSIVDCAMPMVSRDVFAQFLWPWEGININTFGVYSWSRFHGLRATCKSSTHVALVHITDPVVAAHSLVPCFLGAGGFCW